MDRRRALSPVYARQWSTASSSESASPAASPAHPDSRNQSISGFSTIKRNQNVAAKAAARRLAQVMASQTPADDGEEDDDDLGFRLPLASNGGGNNTNDALGRLDVNNNRGLRHGNIAGYGSRTNRSPSPALGRNHAYQVPAVCSSSTGRSTPVRTAMIVPPAKPSLRTPSAISHVEIPVAKAKRFLSDFGNLNFNDLGNQQDASVLRDELDILQEENEISLERLRQAEEKREEAEARVRELEKQVTSLGDGFSLEAKLLSRKEAAIRQSEAALKAAKENRQGKGEEIASLHAEVENLKEEAALTTDRFQQTEAEAKALRTMTQRMILTKEEMEEVVLKRCWLARYWGLGIQHGVCADIAVSKHEHWSSLAPLPFEVVISAAQRAKEDILNEDGRSPDKGSSSVRDHSNLTGEGNIETMLSVEMALRELASLKIEDAVVLAMARLRRPSLVKDPKSTGDPKFMEAFELSLEEADDVLFKQAWLIYFWKRAKDHGVDEDIAEERLQYWIGRTGQVPTSHDAVDVERGMTELKKLGVEQQLWEASRKEIEHLSMASAVNHKQMIAESDGSP